VNPRPELVTEVLRPLRSQVSANVPAIMTLREILDGIIIAYTAFCLEGDKKAPGDNYLITGWHRSGRLRNLAKRSNAPVRSPHRCPSRLPHDPGTGDPAGAQMVAGHHR
jgi:hypothetical protein